MTIYYVDKTTGNDSDSGLTEELAWETINKVNTSSFSAGDIIKFKKGEVWREQLTPPSAGSSGSPITFNYYGSGNDPIISAANIFTGWTSESLNGATIYYATCSTDPDEVHEDGTFLIEKTVKANLVVGTWYFDSGNSRLYVRTSGDDDPVGYTIEGGARTRGIFINDKGYITIDGIETGKGRTGEAIKVRNSNYVKVTNFIVKGYVDRGVHFHNSDNGEISDGTIMGGTLLNTQKQRPIEIGTWGDAPSACDTLAISGNDVSGNKQTPQNSEGIVVRYSTNITIDNNAVHDVGIYGIDIINSTSNSTVSNNTVYNVGSSLSETGTIGIEVQASCDNISVYGNTVYAVERGSSSIDGVGIFVDTSTTNSVFYNNLIYNIAASGIRVYHANNNDIYYNIIYDVGNNPNVDDQKCGIAVNKSYNIEIYNNVVSPEEKYGIRLLGAGGDTTYNVTIKNNIVYKSTSHGIHVDANSTSGFVSDYNDFYWTAGICGHWSGTDCTALSDWRTQSTEDANSIDSDPSFTDAPNDDYTLQSGSPCINAGTDVGLTQDYESKTVPQGSAPEMGAYEYVPWTTFQLDPNAPVYSDNDIVGKINTAVADITRASSVNADTVFDGTTNKAFTGTEQTKLSGAEDSATADQTGAEIKTAYEAETGAYTDTKDTKLTNIEDGATADQTGDELISGINSGGTAITREDALDQDALDIIKTNPQTGEYKVKSAQRKSDGKVEIKYDDVAV